MTAFLNLRLRQITIKDLEDILFSAVTELRSYCDNSFEYEQQLIDTLVNLGEEINDEVYFYWFAVGQPNISNEEQKNIPNDVNDKLSEEFDSKIDNLEKLIIRGSEGGAPVSNEERTEWWKMQKQREREEFYKLNGYYEDEE